MLHTEGIFITSMYGKVFAPLLEPLSIESHCGIFRAFSAFGITCDQTPIAVVLTCRRRFLGMIVERVFLAEMDHFSFRVGLRAWLLTPRSRIADRVITLQNAEELPGDC